MSWPFFCGGGGLDKSCKYRGQHAINYRDHSQLAKNSTFGIAHAAGFDTTNIAYQAVMNAGGSGASPDKIAEALRKAQVSGLLGTVNYTEKNENTKIVHIFTASDGVPHHVDQK